LLIAYFAGTFAFGSGKDHRMQCLLLTL